MSSCLDIQFEPWERTHFQVCVELFLYQIFCLTSFQNHLQFFFFFCFFYSDSSSLNSSALSAFNNLSAAALYVLFFGMFSSDSKVPAALFCSHFVQNRCFSISLLDLNVPRSKSRSISSYLLFEIMVSELCRITSEEASFSSWSVCCKSKKVLTLGLIGKGLPYWLTKDCFASSTFFLSFFC